MNFISKLWANILNMLGFTNVQINDIADNGKFEDQYQDTNDTNFTAILANKVASLTMVDSEISVEGDNKRAIYMSETLTKFWKKKMKKVISTMLGVGGTFVFPRVTNGKLLFDIIPQSRVSINKSLGDEILSVTMLAEVKKIKNRNYYRWIYYNLDQKTKTAKIENLVTDDEGTPTTLDIWSDLKNYYINNVEYSLFAFFKSPINNRNVDDNYGVPITFGSNKTLDRIIETLEQIDKEFEYKETRIFADERLFEKDQSNQYKIKDKFFKLLHGTAGQQTMMDIFSPAIRESSYYFKLESLMKTLENECGVSAGVITRAESRGATATEIKANNVDTYSLLCDIRNEIEQSMDELKYACDVLLNYFNVVPQGDFNVDVKWSYLLVENSQEAFEQMIQAKAMGAISTAEVRRWVMPNETLEEAQEKINEIIAQQQNLMNNFASRIDE